MLTANRVYFRLDLFVAQFRAVRLLFVRVRHGGRKSMVKKLVHQGTLLLGR